MGYIILILVIVMVAFDSAPSLIGQSATDTLTIIGLVLFIAWVVWIFVHRRPKK